MRLWRIARAAYPPFEGLGGLHGAGRWHNTGRRIVYCAMTPGDAQLETIVHLEIDLEDLPVDLRLYAADLPDDLPMQDAADLPADWRLRIETTRALGDAWLAAGEAPALRVPSALVPYSSNVLLNPAHPVLAGIAPVIDEPLLLDPRLLRVRGD
jgi:RES domain-containing protein